MVSEDAKGPTPIPEKASLWRRMSGPLKVGLGFALVAILMAIVGLVRGSASAPLTVRSVLMAILISGGTWGLVSWAIATAVVEVERDVAECDGEGAVSGQTDESGV